MLRQDLGGLEEPRLMSGTEVETFLSQLADWAATRPDVAAVGLTGSLARGAAGPRSDVDIVILCSNGDQLLCDRSIDLPLKVVGDPSPRRRHSAR